MSNKISISRNSSEPESASSIRNRSTSSQDSGYGTSMSNYNDRARSGSLGSQGSAGWGATDSSSGSNGSNGYNGYGNGSGSNGSSSGSGSRSVHSTQHTTYGNTAYGVAHPGNPGTANPGPSHHTAAMTAANMSATSWANSNEWDKHRDLITRLYRDQGLHLKKVQSYMAKEFNFHASERMYKTRISKWNLDKNLKAADVLIMYRLYQGRAMMGKKSEFTVRGRYMDYARVEQYIRRDPSILTRVPPNDDFSDIPSDPSTGITCRTPTPSPPPSPVHGQSAHVQMPHHVNTYHHPYSYGPPLQQHAQHSHSHRRQHLHGVAHHANHTHHLPGVSLPVLPSHAPVQMQLPVATSNMGGYAGMTTAASSGASPYTSGTTSSSPFSSLTATAGVASSPFNTMGDSSSGYSSISTAGSNSSGSAYEFSAPGSFGTSASAPGLATSSSPSSLGMMPTHVSTPRTVNTDGRFGSHSFAPMSFSAQQAAQAHGPSGTYRHNSLSSIVSHDQYGEHIPQISQGPQQGPANGIAAAHGSNYAPYGSAPNGSGPSSANGNGSNPSLHGSYDWPPWGSQFR